MDNISILTLMAASAEADTGNFLLSFLSLAISIVTIVAMWKLFEKAGEAGWKSIIPIYNNYILFKIVYGNGWKFLLTIVPILNIVVIFAVYIRLALVFGKGVGFAILSLFFTPVTTCILAFGSAEYEGPVNSFI